MNIQGMDSDDIERLIREKQEAVQGMKEGRMREVYDDYLNTKRRKEIIGELGAERERERGSRQGSRDHGSKKDEEERPAKSARKEADRGGALATALGAMQEENSGLKRELEAAKRAVREARESEERERERMRELVEALEREAVEAREEAVQVGRELGRLVEQQARVMASTEEEMEMVKSDEIEAELRAKKLEGRLAKTEFDFGNKMIELQQELTVAQRSAREAEARIEKLAEGFAKEREYLEKKLTSEKEKHRETVHNCEKKLMMLKEELRLAERDLVLVKKSNIFLEKRVSKHEKGNSESDGMKAEIKKLLGLSVELTADIMTFAKGEKVMMPLFKTFQHRQLNIEKKYKQVRSNIAQNVGKSKPDPIEKRENKNMGSRNNLPPTRSRSKVVSVYKAISNRSRSNSVASQISQKSKQSNHSKKSNSTGFNKSQKLTNSGNKIPAVRERSNSASRMSREDSRRKKIEKTARESGVLVDFNPKRVHGSDFSTEDIASKDFSRFDGKGPAFYEPSAQSPSKNQLFPLPIFSREILSHHHHQKTEIPGELSSQTREEVKMRVRETEDEVLLLKKLYREKLAKGQIGLQSSLKGSEQQGGQSYTSDLLKVKSELTKLSSEIEQKSELLLKLRKHMRETDSSAGFKSLI